LSGFIFKKLTNS